MGRVPSAKHSVVRQKPLCVQGFEGRAEAVQGAAGLRVRRMRCAVRILLSCYAWRACRGLEAMLTQRRALLQYMRRHDFDTYAVTLSRLDLKDNFAKQVPVSLFCALRTCRSCKGFPRCRTFHGWLAGCKRLPGWLAI